MEDITITRQVDNYKRFSNISDEQRELNGVENSEKKNQ